MKSTNIMKSITNEEDKSESDDEMINFNGEDFENDISIDVWNDLKKYITRKAPTSLEEKIKKIYSEKQMGANQLEVDLENFQEDQNVDICSLKNVADYIKTKKKTRKSNKKNCHDKLYSAVENFPSFEALSFHEMNLSRPLLKALATMNIVYPTAVQSSTIPVALLGRDICGCAATGTGKTAAFMLPVLERLLFRPKADLLTRVLVLVPTRELGVQVYQVSKQLAQFSTVQIALSVGGLDVKIQEIALRQFPDIVIATPGRLIDHLQNTPSFSLDSIEVLILDEADRMLDEYFAEQMKEIIRQCSPKRQTLLFSATMTDEVKDLAAVSLNNPVKIFINNNTDVANNLQQEFVRPNREGDREAILVSLLCRSFKERTLVFLQTKIQTHRMHILLGLLGMKVTELHGNLTQVQRLESLQKFKDGEASILLATDVAARGLDIPGVKTVVNFTLPPTMKHYVHRVGRTARAGRTGRSVSLVGESERNLLKEIVKYSLHPVKCRIIPVEVLEKIKNKLQELDPDIETILRQEKEEKELKKAECKVRKLEKIIEKKDNKGKTRTWFQSKKEKLQEKNKEDKKNKYAVKRSTPEDRAFFEMQKIEKYQARLAKRNRKHKKLYSMKDNVQHVSKVKKRQFKTSFDEELLNTSKSAVKRFRYIQPQHRKL